MKKAKESSRIDNPDTDFCHTCLSYATDFSQQGGWHHCLMSHASTASDDTNQIIQVTYTMDGLQATLVAQNGRTTDQTTTFTFGTSVNEIGLPASDVASSLLLQYIDLPGSTDGPGGTNSITFTYNRQGQRTSVKDQRGCVHQYLYDLLGRQTNDCVTTPGTDVDTAVLRLLTTYEVRGLILELTSYNSAAATLLNNANICDEHSRIIWPSIEQPFASLSD